MMDAIDSQGDKRRRVLVISHDFGRLGAQMMLLHLLGALVRARPAWEIRILGREPNGTLAPEFAQLGRVDVFWPEPGLRRPGAHQENLREELRTWQPEVIYANTSVNGDVTDFLALPVPLLVHVHEMRHYLGLLDAGRRESLCRTPTGYLAASHAVKDVLITDFALPADRIDVMYEAIDLERIDRLAKRHDREVMRNEFQIPAHARVVGTIGRIDARKGWDLFARMAVQLLERDDPTAPWYFVWLGHGPEHEKLKAAFAQAGHAGRIIAPGARENPFPAYAGMDVFVQTSREDPCPLTVLEAAYLGKPVVVFGPSGGAREVVGQGCGVVLPNFEPEAMAAAVAELTAHPARAASLGQRGPAIIRSGHDVRDAGPRVALLLEHLMRNGTWPADPVSRREDDLLS